MKVGLRLGILALLLTPFWESGSLSGVALAEDHLLVAQAPEPARRPMPSVPRSIPSPVPIAPAESSETVDELFRQVPFPPSPRPLPGLPCSRPMVLRSVTLSAPPPNPASPLQSEVPPNVWATLQGPFGTVNWGDRRPDKVFAHTFQWSPPCKTGCRMGGTLTFTYSNNLQATSNTTPDAGNDKYYLFNSAISTGGTSPPTQATQAGFLYTFPSPPTSPIPPGQTFTKTLTLSPAEIANNQVTLVVQDDTAVLGAKLELRYCCCECEFPI
jgi:hypothetical protein